MANINIRPRAAVAERPPFAAPPSGNTRLGLHVTSDELAIWQTRRTDNVNGINGFTYKNIYDNRILAAADSFKAPPHPNSSRDGRWDGYTGAG